jgi:subtilisin family serine protease
VRHIVRTVTALGVTAGVVLGAGPAVATARPLPADPAVEVPVLREAPLATTPDAPAPDPGAVPAEPDAAPDQVLVQFAPGVDAAQQADALAAEGVAAVEGIEGTEFVEVPVGDAAPVDVAAALAADPRVADVQLDLVRTAQARPADELLDLALPSLELMRLPRAWDVGTGTGQVIAVLDTGVDLSHPDLAGRLVAGYDFVEGDDDPSDDEWHGTAVAGVAAATGGNREGSAGAAYGAKIMPVKVLDSTGSGYDSAVAQGIQWAVDHGADVINLSLGGPGASPVLRAAMADAVARGAVVLAAAGNSGTETPGYPAAYAPELDGLLSVGATDAAGVLTPFSSWGDTVTVTAPGKSLVAPSNGGGYLTASGTSFSAPLVSGAAALLTSRGRTPAQVEAALVSTARDAGPRGRDPYYGAGVVDAAAALGLGGAVPLERGPAGGADSSLPARAVPLALSASVTGALTPEGDEDWYAVDVPVAGWYTATVTPSGSAQSTRPRVTALAADGEVLATASAGTEGSPLTLHVPVPVAGEVRVGVANVDGSRGDRYSVTLAPAAGAEPPVGTGAHAWVVDSNLVPHQAGTALRPALTVTLGRSPAAGSVSAGTVRLLDAVTGAAVPGSVTFDAAVGVASLTPAADLVPGRHYQLHVAGLTDTAGDVQPTPFRVPFTVGADGERFTPVDPWRVVDTRTAKGGAGPVRPSAPVRADLGDRVPADATAVVLNVTAVSPGTGGWVRVYPTPTGAQATPVVSNLNVVAGVTQANAVTVALGAGGDVTLATSTTTDLLADVAGYYRAGGSTAYTPLDPVRVLDTRTGDGGVPKAAVRGGAWVDLVVRGRAGVPADASAVVLNVTGVSPSAATNVRVYPAPAASEAQSPPTVSNLNLVPGRAQPNLVTVKVGDGGRVRLWSQSGTVDLVADLAGYYSPSGAHGFVPLAPARIADSRQGTGVAGALRGSVPSRLVVRGAGGVPADAVAAVLNVTAVKASASSDLRVYPERTDGVVPLVSNLNMPKGRDEPNLVVTRIGDGGAVQLYARADVHVVVDVSGYFRR